MRCGGQRVGMVSGSMPCVEAVADKHGVVAGSCRFSLQGPFYVLQLWQTRVGASAGSVQYSCTWQGSLRPTRPFHCPVLHYNHTALLRAGLPPAGYTSSSQPVLLAILEARTHTTGTTPPPPRYPMLLVGPTGTGKTVYTAAYLRGLDASLFTPPNTLGFSAQTSAGVAQSLVDSKLDKRRKVRLCVGRRAPCNRQRLWLRVGCWCCASCTGANFLSGTALRNVCVFGAAACAREVGSALPSPPCALAGRVRPPHWQAGHHLRGRPQHAHEAGERPALASLPSPFFSFASVRCNGVSILVTKVAPVRHKDE